MAWCGAVRAGPVVIGGVRYGRYGLAWEGAVGSGL